MYYITHQNLFHYCRIKWAFFCNVQKHNNILRTEDVSESTTRGYFVLAWLIFAGAVTTLVYNVDVCYNDIVLFELFNLYCNICALCYNTWNIFGTCPVSLVPFPYWVLIYNYRDVNMSTVNWYRGLYMPIYIIWFLYAQVRYQGLVWCSHYGSWKHM